MVGKFAEEFLVTRSGAAADDVDFSQAIAEDRCERGDDVVLELIPGMVTDPYAPVLTFMLFTWQHFG